MKSLIAASSIYKQPFKYLQSRNLLYYASNPQLIESDHIESILPKDSSVYIGFDPTAESIHLGNLIGLLTLSHFRFAGYNPIILFGGATGLIGDPSGRSSERKQIAAENVEHNIQKFQSQFKYLISNIESSLQDTYDMSQTKQFTFVNNYDFYKDMNIIQFLREVGVHYRLGNMLSKDSVKARMEGGADEGGMSFTEFSYQIFQGYDFYRLRKQYNCKLQIGGSDQWGNIASGCELIRRMTGGEEAFGATIPLLVNSQGEKYGKSSGNTGALWLDPTKTTPYQFYQFLLNLPDSEVESLLLQLTFISHEQIQKTMSEHSKHPESRVAQKLLAKALTEMVHGKDSIQSVISSTDAFFGINLEKDLQSMSQSEFEEHFSSTEKCQFSIKDIKDISSLIVKCGLRDTKADVRRVIQQGGLAINGQKVNEDRALSENDLMYGKYIVAKIGKKRFVLAEFIKE